MSQSLDDLAMQVSADLMLSSSHLKQMIGKDGQIIKREQVVRYSRIMENAAQIIDKLGIASEDERRRYR